MSELAINNSVVLIVDDAIDTLEVLKFSLPKNCSIVTAENGKEAVSSAKQNLPNLILLDINLPDISGYDVLEQLKKDKTTADIPIIFITQRSDIDSELFALKKGAVDFIHKPIVPTIVRARVTMQLQLQKHQQQMNKVIAELMAFDTESKQALQKETKERKDLATRLSNTIPEKTSLIQSNAMLRERLSMMQEKITSLESSLRKYIKHQIQSDS